MYNDHSKISWCILKVATLNDLTEIADMSMKFIDTTEYSPYADRSTIEELITSIVASDGTEKIIIMEPGVGFLAGCISPFLFGPYILASEIAWWVEPEHRGKEIGLEFLKAFEYWAKEKAGADMVCMVCLDDKLCKFYEKQGYRLRERAYLKEI